MLTLHPSAWESSSTVEIVSNLATDPILNWLIDMLGPICMVSDDPEGRWTIGSSMDREFKIA